jgi:hypothetical protein
VIDLHLTYKLSRCCQSTLDSNPVPLESEFSDYLHTVYLEAEHLQAAVFLFNDYSVLAFHHTNDWLDWHTNLDLCAVKDFHGGYYKAVQRFIPLLQPIIGSRPFYLTGHSMGGALATIYSLEFLENDHWLGTYAFGSPRIVTRRHHAAAQNKLEGKVLTIQNQLDVISRLPLNYKQLGEALYITPELTISKQNRLSWLAIIGAGLSKVYASHLLGTFVNALQKAK